MVQFIVISFLHTQNSVCSPVHKCSLKFMSDDDDDDDDDALTGLENCPRRDDCSVSPDEEGEVCVCFAGMDSGVLREMMGEYVTR